MFIACMSFKNISIMLSSDFLVHYLVNADTRAQFIEDYKYFFPSALTGQESSPWRLEFGGIQPLQSTKVRSINGGDLRPNGCVRSRTDTLHHSSPEHPSLSPGELPSVWLLSQSRLRRSATSACPLTISGLWSPGLCLSFMKPPNPTGKIRSRDKKSHKKCGMCGGGTQNLSGC